MNLLETFFIDIFIQFLNIFNALANVLLWKKKKKKTPVTISSCCKEGNFENQVTEMLISSQDHLRCLLRWYLKKYLVLNLIMIILFVRFYLMLVIFGFFVFAYTLKNFKIEKLYWPQNILLCHCLTPKWYIPKISLVSYS